MNKIKVHYDGWICLPTTVRRRLGISAGDQLTCEYGDGGIVIRSGTAATTSPPATKDEPASAPAAKPATRSKRATASAAARKKSAAASKGKE